MSEVSPTGWSAVYKSKDGHEWSTPVESFDSGGNPLVVDPNAGVLIPARNYGKFVALQPSPRSCTVVPSPPGWFVTAPDGEDEDWSEPVVAWLVFDDGTGQPMTPTWDTGTIDCANIGGAYKLVGPEESKRKP